MEGVISSHEATAQFGNILARVELGEELVITRNDLPIARIIPENRQKNKEMAAWIAAMRKRREGRKINVEGLPHITIRELIEDGRK